MVPRRSIVSTAISAALHGAAIAIALWAFSGPPDHAPPSRPPEVIAFDVVVAPPPPPPLPDRPPPPPRAVHAAPAPAGARALSAAGHRGHDTPRSALLPSAGHDGELTISMDTPIGPDADGQGSEHGLGSSGLGAGPDGPGTGTALAIPDPPHLSARPPRPKYDYSEVTIHGSRIYTGKQIKLLLTIDAHGVVRGARILQSVEFQFDLRAVRKALQFEFDPGLDTNGQPTKATLPWTFIVTL